MKILWGWFIHFFLRFLDQTNENKTQRYPFTDWVMPKHLQIIAGGHGFMSLQSELPMNPLLMCALSLSPLTHELIKSLEKGKTEKMRKEEGGEEPRMPKDEN